LLISTSHGLGQTVLSQINPYFFNVSYRPAWLIHFDTTLFAYGNWNQSPSDARIST
jgi:hypothetical protein